MENLEALRSENRSLRIMAEQDSLTGLLNRRTIEDKINQSIKLDIPGVFIMIDLDGFKLINNKYGHLTGDKILQELGKLIPFFFSKQDLVGRIGGDEFVVFMVGEYEKSSILERIESLRNRIRQTGMVYGLKRSLEFTAGAALVKKKDTFRQLYEHADCAMRSGKQGGKNRLCFYEDTMKYVTTETLDSDGQMTDISDMKYIIQELKESETPDGTYCQDYHTFLSTYRLIERLLGRFGLKCHIMLITMMDASGAYVKLDELPLFMDKLRESICFALRTSDVYAQYSSSQFLVMTPGAEKKDMSIITDRIKQEFQRILCGRTDIVLTFSYYPMRASTGGKKRDCT